MRPANREKPDQKNLECRVFVPQRAENGNIVHVPHKGHSLKKQNLKIKIN